MTNIDLCRKLISNKDFEMIFENASAICICRIDTNTMITLDCESDFFHICNNNEILFDVDGCDVAELFNL